MKRILVTGLNSYIGTSFQKWVSQFPEMYSVDFISLRDNLWKERSFSKYDVIFHTAAIVHVKENDTEKYFKVNRDLTIELAEKAKLDGVKQFIFLSTMGVYGIETGTITKNTVPLPKTPYASSKYEAEQLLIDINSRDFNIAILRPPIVYGKDCPGNYARLADMAKKLPIFPNVKNNRSMIFIDNLSEFIRLLIDNNQSGIYFPQNKEYVNTAELVRLIATVHGKNIILSGAFNFALGVGLKLSVTLRKVFGTYIYDKSLLGGPQTLLKENKLEYEVISFEDSITRTEGRV